MIQWILVTVALLLTRAGQAEIIGVPDWQASALQRQGQGIALDGANNAYFLSSATGVVTLDRYTSKGVQRWSRSLLTGATGSEATVLIDGAGNAIVLGTIFAKYAPNGRLLWSRTLPGASLGARVWTALTDATGDIYTVASDSYAAGLVVSRFAAATGQTLWTNALPDPNLYNARVRRTGNQLVVSAGNDARLLVVALDAATGTVLATHNEPVPAAYSDVAIGPSGEIVVVAGASLLLPGATFTVFTLDSSLTSVLLERSLTDGVSARRVAVDAQGNIYLTGAATEPDPTSTIGSDGTVTQGPYADWLTMKLDPLGTVLWSVRLSQRTDINEVPRTMHLAPDGSVYVAGLAGDPGAARPSYAATTVQYSSTGAALWRATSTQNQDSVDVARGSNGSVYVVGGSPQGTLWHYPALAKPTALLLSKSSVNGGMSVTGTVRVGSAAGVVVALASSNPSAAVVPATVTVPPGATIAKFTVNTSRVPATTVVEITASANGGDVRTALTVKL